MSPGWCKFKLVNVKFIRDLLFKGILREHIELIYSYEL